MTGKYGQANNEYWVYGVFSTTVKAENETQAIRLVENMGLSDLDRWDITDIEEG